MSSTISPNMGLTIPTVGSEAGPTYAIDINNALTLVDAHDHTPGFGVQIPANGININSTLSFNGNIANNVGALILSQLSGTNTTLGALSATVSGLYYTGFVGGPVQITNSSGQVVSPPGNITGLVSPAEVTYSAGLFTFLSNSTSSPTIPANIDFGVALFRNSAPANVYALTLSAPTLSSNVSLTLPLPVGHTAFLQIDSAGNIAANSLTSALLLGTQIANNTITTNQINATAGILGTQLALNTITSSNITTSGGNRIQSVNLDDGIITQPKLAALPIAYSGSSGADTGTASATFVAAPAGGGGSALSTTVTTTGRPVYVSIVADGTSNAAAVQLSNTLGGADLMEAEIRITESSSGMIVTLPLLRTVPGSSLDWTPASAFNTVFSSSSGSTTTYTVAYKLISGTGTISIANCKLVAYEL